MEATSYFSGSQINCLLCGQPYETLNTHLLYRHKTTAKEYRLLYGLPFNRGLVSENLHGLLSELARKSHVKRSGPVNLIGRLLQDGGIKAGKDYQVKYLRQYPDLKRVLKKDANYEPDDWAAILKEEGYAIESGDDLIELLKTDAARSIFTPDKRDDAIERMIRRLENEWLETLDLGTISETESDLKTEIIGELKTEGTLYSEEIALSELNEFFASCSNDGGEQLLCQNRHQKPCQKRLR